MSEKSKPPKEVTTSFTIDDDQSLVNEMPGVTRLLNRKSFPKSLTSQVPAPPPVAPPSAPPRADLKPPPGPPPGMKAPSGPPPGPSAPPSFSSSPPAAGTANAPEATQSTKTLSVQRAGRRRTSATPLLAWTIDEFKQGNDPLGKAILSLLEGGVSQCLFLAVELQAGKPLPVFKAMASLNAGSQATIWTGLSWDPQLLPDVWSMLLSTGVVEFSPPATKTQMDSIRNLSRSAFDTAPDQWLTLVRVGLPKECRGLLALVSKASVVPAVKKAQPLLNQGPKAATPVKKSA